MKFHKIALFLVAIMSIFTLSCQHRVEEPRVIATISDEVVITKQVGVEFDTYAPSFTIKLEGANFNTIANTDSLIIGGEDIGVTVIAQNGVTDNATYGEFKITGTPKKALQGPVKLQIPASFIKGRVNPVTVEAKGLYWNIVDNRAPYAKNNGSVGANSTLNRYEYDMTSMPGTIILQGATLKNVSNEMDITQWIKNSSSVAPNLKFYLSIDETQANPDSFKVLIDGSFDSREYYSFRSMSIPAEYLNINPANSSNVSRVFIEGGFYLGRGDHTWCEVAFTEKADINGVFSVAEPKLIRVEIPIKLTNISFMANADSRDVSGWFTHTVSGLTYTLLPIAQTGMQTATIVVEGMPTDVSDAPLELVNLPAYYGDSEFRNVFNSSTYSTGNWLSDTKGSMYNISVPSDAFVYHIYDLASFGDTALSSVSPNRSLTKTYDDGGSESDITFRDDNSIYVGDTKEATFPGFTRRGYKLVGFARPNADGTVSTDVSDLAYKLGDGGNVIENPTTHALTLNLADEDRGKLTRLYAVWEIDPAAWGWTLNEDGSYDKAHDISGYDPSTGENAFFPATFNLAKSGISSDDQAKYQDYPYYKEAKVLAKGLSVPSISTATSTDYTDYEDVILDHDFLIGEQAITGYMLDVLREWNNGNGTDDNPEKGYELPIEAVDTSPSGRVTSSNNTVGYGASYEASAYRPNNEKSDPITYVTVPQAMVISNAFTEYYNEKHASTAGFTPLTYAYVKEGSSEAIKTIADADALYNTPNTNGEAMAAEGATGFRLPTQDEWTIASRIVPESNYEARLTGAHTGAGNPATRNYLYPQLHRNDMWSGANVLSTGSANDPLANTWVWNYYSVDVNQYRTTHGFLKASKDGTIQNWTVLDKKPNNIGVYGMSGNVWEWCDTVIAGTGRRLRGGSFANSASYTRVGYLGSDSASGRFGRYGLRLVRLP